MKVLFAAIFLGVNTYFTVISECLLCRLLHFLFGALRVKFSGLDMFCDNAQTSEMLLSAKFLLNPVHACTECQPWGFT